MNLDCPTKRDMRIIRWILYGLAAFWAGVLALVIRACS